MRIGTRNVFLLAAVGLAGASAARAGVIYSDTFSGTAGTLLNGHAPDVVNAVEGGSATAAWSAATTVGTPATGGSALWTLDGAGHVGISSAASAAAANRDDASMIANATIPFVPVAGLVYDAKITLAPEKGDGTSGNWLGLAFAQAAYNGHGPSGQALSNNNPYGLLILKPTGVLQTFGGVGTGNGVTNTAGTVDIASAHVIDLTLDTTGALWSVSWKLDGTAIGSFNYAANPSIGLFSFGTNKHQGAVSAFSLTSNSVPEPMTASLLAVPAAALVRRKRR